MCHIERNVYEFAVLVVIDTNDTWFVSGPIMRPRKAEENVLTVTL
jgi:hypothetical protein